MGKPVDAIARLATLFGVDVLALSGPGFADPQQSPDPVPQKQLLGYLADNSTFTLIDARSAEEFEASHVSGAVNVPVGALDDSAELLPVDRDAPIVVYCKTGKRATVLKDKLVERGYTDVQVLRADQIHWFDDMAVFNCATPSATSAADPATALVDGPREENP